MTSPTQSNTLGEFLRSEREKRGLSLEQVAAATKIGFKILHALEADQFEALPAKPFIRGFIISYCRFIGLDAKEILARYNVFIDDRAKMRPNREAQFSGYAFDKREGDTSRTFLWIIMTSFFVLGGLFMIVFKPALKHRSHRGADKLRAIHASPSPSVSALPISPPSPLSAPLPMNSPAPQLPALSTPSPVPTAAPSPVPSLVPVSPVPQNPKASPSATPVQPSSATTAKLSLLEADAADPLASGKTIPAASIRHRLVVKALADVWVRYRSDGRPIMKFVLLKDRVLVVRATELLQFQASNPKAVRTTYNQRAWKILNEEPKIRRLEVGAELVYGNNGQTSGLDGIPKEFQIDNSLLPATQDPINGTESATP